MFVKWNRQCDVNCYMLYTLNAISNVTSILPNMTSIVALQFIGSVNIDLSVNLTIIMTSYLTSKVTLSITLDATSNMAKV